ncbi:MAG: flavodoxin [Syntrophales bacterium]
MPNYMVILKAGKLTILLISLFVLSCVGPAQQLTPADMSIIRPDTNSLVVVHSRSGNTAKMGHIISEKLNSDYIRLDVPAGSGDSMFAAPNRNDTVYVKPSKVDLTKYQLVFLGSPIWFWHPTAFIYTFVKHNDFNAKKVVLFYTNHGGLAEKAMDEWKGLVQQHGGTVIDVIGINSKIFNTDEALQAEVEAIIARQKSLWISDNAKIRD